jgi:mevalonate kinase
MGEYLALEGGPALLAVLEPRFQLKIKKVEGSQGKGQGKVEGRLSKLEASLSNGEARLANEEASLSNGETRPVNDEASLSNGEARLVNISLQSPAGIFYRKNQKFFSAYDIEFYDPYNGAGGWGASSAQYAMLAAFFYGQSTMQTDAQWNLDLQQIDSDYLKITSQNSTGLRPSGMDVIAQLRGGLVLIDRNKGHIENLIWPFNDVSFLLFATGVKVPTHTHLSELNELPMAQLKESAQKFNLAFMNLDKQALVDSMNDFRNTLLESKLELANTTDWINKVKGLEGVLAVKGCGAMGADVVVVLVEKAAESSVISGLKSLGLNSIVSKDQLTGPLQSYYENPQINLNNQGALESFEFKDGSVYHNSSFEVEQ